MKTSTLPPVRVDDDFRAQAESVLAEGETLSAFIEASVRREVRYRQVQTDFHARGQASLEEYRHTGVSRSAEEVANRLRERIESRRRQIAG